MGLTSEMSNLKHNESSCLHAKKTIFLVVVSVYKIILSARHEKAYGVIMDFNKKIFIFNRFPVFSKNLILFINKKRKTLKHLKYVFKCYMKCYIKCYMKYRLMLR